MKSDVDLQRDVVDELAWEPSIEAAQIGVIAREGIVTLTGHVATHAEKHTAEKVAKRVHGVKAVADELEVRPGEHHQRGDEDIAAAAVQALEWDSAVPSDRLQVTVEKGRVRLEGTVDHKFEKTAAARAVRQLIGVRGVSNAIVVQPLPVGRLRRRPDEVRSDIEAALRRSATVDSSRITVEIQRDKAILTGDVHSQSERDEVVRIASTAREVSDVESCLTVTPWGWGPMEEWGY